MAAHNIDGPGTPDEPWVTSEVAAKYVGVSKDAFLRLIGRKKGGGAIPGITEWMHRHPHSKEAKWHAVDVGIVARIMAARRNGTPPPPPEDDDEDESSEKS